MKTIWVNGCFDVLHVGHVELLEYAKSIGDRLVVGIDHDNRVKELKGKDRPINSTGDRMRMLKALKCVDEVTFFRTEDHLRYCIEKYAIDVMVVGDEYKDKEVIGSELVGEVKFFKKIDGYSSTNIIKGLL
jgi:D-beta-D-heptose 7-phosphate kinase/D-beta-D-heptose 1-phosphate adenosyltransferase